GEVIGADGGRHELQLKGAGPTPYSRHADGRAVLRSSLREFVCSEAMHHLGVPTTRALSLIGSGDEVVRDMFYDGHPQAEPGAIVCRVAPSFLRFGHFELPAARKDPELLTRLVDFTISRDYPEMTGSPDQRRADWFIQICERTARLIAQWMRVGFVHGVMNTDNL
ncbi:MAG: YdiU family protein, partial [Xanthomonadales bacterium]|nr:YdiU family protein [Xanthomonadales bacterium]